MYHRNEYVPKKVLKEPVVSNYLKNMLANPAKFRLTRNLLYFGTPISNVDAVSFLLLFVSSSRNITISFVKASIVLNSPSPSRKLI